MPRAPESAFHFALLHFYEAPRQLSPVIDRVLLPLVCSLGRLLLVAARLSNSRSDQLIVHIFCGTAGRLIEVVHLVSRSVKHTRIR